MVNVRNNTNGWKRSQHGWERRLWEKLLSNENGSGQDILMEVRIIDDTNG